MKRKIIFLPVLALIGLSGWGQIEADKEWFKNPATYIYSLEYDRKVKEDFYKQNQKKYASHIDLVKVVSEAENINEGQRLNAIRVLGLITDNNQISRIETMLVSDPSLSVRMECSKSLKYLKSSKSIPGLIKALNNDDRQLKLEIALTLASLGEKTECFKALKELGRTGERNIILDTHLGYLDLATDDAIEKLRMDLLDNDSYISVDAAIVLAELGYFKEAFPVLQSNIKNFDKTIRLGVLRGLAYIGNENSIELIRDMLNDSNQLVKNRSALILKNCHLN